MSLPQRRREPYNHLQCRIRAPNAKRRTFMPDVLKGNFQTKKKVDVKESEQELEDRFESEALKNLGGSIAFVSKKKVKWDAEGSK